MEITSRGRLIELINNNGIATYPVESKKGTRAVNTIIHCKKRNEFYRLVWGEVKGNNKVVYLWYDETADKVKLDSSSGLWLTKEERSDKVDKGYESTIGGNIKQFALYNEKDDLVFINGIKTTFKEEDGFNKVNVVAGKTGKGKTEHVLRKVGEAIIKDESILFFAIEESEQEILRRLIRVMALDVYTKFENREILSKEDLIKLGDTLHLIANSKMIIINNDLIDDNYIIDKMHEVANEENGLDLVIIDSLKLSYESRNSEQVISVHEKIDIYRQKLGCKVIITTQMARLA